MTPALLTPTPADAPHSTAAGVLRRLLAADRSHADVVAIAELSPAERVKLQARVTRGTRSADAVVRAAAVRVIEGAEVASWGTGALSAHISQEVAIAYWRGAPLESRETVPGCKCAECSGHVPPAVHAPDTDGIRCPRCHGHRELVRDDSRVWYQCEACRTQSASAWPVSAIGTMARDVPRSVGRPVAAPVHDARELDIDAARSVPLLEVAASLGIEHRRGWAACPFHHDSRPSLHLNTRKGAAFCNPCGRSWDTIALTMELRGLSFPDAVRELTGQRAA